MWGKKETKKKKKQQQQGQKREKAEMLQRIWEKGWNNKVFSLVWKRGGFAKDWKKGLLLLIHKKVGKGLAEN